MISSRFKKRTLKILALGLLTSICGLPGAWAEEPASSEKGIICTQGDKEIYSSISTDIKDFTATRRQLKQVLKKPIANKKGVTAYLFEPGSIVCAVKVLKN